MPPVSRYFIGKSMVTDGITLMQDAAEDKAFIGSHREDDLAAQVLALHALATNLDAVQAKLIANRPAE